MTKFQAAKPGLSAVLLCCRQRHPSPEGPVVLSTVMRLPNVLYLVVVISCGLLYMYLYMRPHLHMHIPSSNNDR